MSGMSGPDGMMMTAETQAIDEVFASLADEPTAEESPLIQDGSANTNLTPTTSAESAQPQGSDGTVEVVMMTSTGEAEDDGSRWGPWGSFGGVATAGFLGIGKVLTYPGRLIPGTGEFWEVRDEALQELYNRSNIGGTGWQTMSEVGSEGAAIALTAGLGGPSSSVAKSAPKSVAKPAVRGMGNIGSHGPIDPSVVLSSAQKWLGSGYKEIAPGVFRSADGLRQFRMTASDLISTHGKIGPHVHFESLNNVGKVIENLHLPILP